MSLVAKEGRSENACTSMCDGRSDAAANRSFDRPGSGRGRRWRQRGWRGWWIGCKRSRWWRQRGVQCGGLARDGDLGNGRGRGDRRTIDDWYQRHANRPNR